jgi:hypothetical protein
MIYFENYSREKLYYLAEDLIKSITEAAWLDDKGKRNLSHPTPHMVDAIQNFKVYTHDPCPTCGQNRRGI